MREENLGVLRDFAFCASVAIVFQKLGLGQRKTEHLKEATPDIHITGGG